MNNVVNADLGFATVYDWDVDDEGDTIILICERLEDCMHFDLRDPMQKLKLNCLLNAAGCRETTDEPIISCLNKVKGKRINKLVNNC